MRSNIAKIRPRPDIDREALWADLNYDKEVVKVINKYNYLSDHIFLGILLKALPYSAMVVVGISLLLSSKGSPFYITLMYNQLLVTGVAMFLLESRKGERKLKKAFLIRNQELRRLFYEENPSKTTGNL